MKTINKLFDFRSFSKILLLNLLSAGTGFLFVFFINKMVNLLVNEKINKAEPLYALYYGLAVIVFLLTKRFLSESIIRFSQQLFWSIRKDILGLVLNLNYTEFTGKKDQILTIISRDVFTLTNSFLSMLTFFSSLVSVLACSVYLAYISFQLFVVTFFCILAGILIYLFRWKKYSLMFQKYRGLETVFMGHVNGMLDGFKEIAINRYKGRIIFETEIAPLAEESKLYRNKSLIGFLNNQLIGQVIMFCLIGSILIYLKFILNIPATKVVNFLFVLMFLRTEMESMMTSVPDVLQAKIASENITQLEGFDIDKKGIDNILKEEKLDFEVLNFTGIEYKYEDLRNSFKIGPINLKVAKGEVIFIYGGNGSGKTTLILLVLGLLQMKKGEIRINNQSYFDTLPENYLSLFSVVFSDYHLFDKFYGINQIDAPRFNNYLKIFELDNKVSLGSDGFSTIDLSAGQRKRLALISALMEDRKIVILDEWAADQDPYFRKKFYQNILPLMRLEGYTVIAVTHDDKYYDCADKIYQMHEGKLILEKEPMYDSKIS